MMRIAEVAVKAEAELDDELLFEEFEEFEFEPELEPEFEPEVLISTP